MVRSLVFLLKYKPLISIISYLNINDIVVFFWQVGVVMYYARTNRAGSQDSVALILSLTWEVSLNLKLKTLGQFPEWCHCGCFAVFLSLVFTTVTPINILLLSWFHLLHQLVSSVRGLYFKDIKQSLKKEHCDVSKTLRNMWRYFALSTIVP